MRYLHLPELPLVQAISSVLGSDAMNNHTQSELAKVRKLADVSVNLKNEMKQSFIEEKLRTLNATIKKLAEKKDAHIELFFIF
jgi:hypothetical protein